MKPMNAIAAWDSRELAEVARIETGGTPPTSDRSLYGNDVPFASPADIGAQRWITTTDKNLSLAGWNRARRLPAGSILVVCIGSTIGKVGMAAIPMATNQQINAVIPSEKIDRDFLYYFLCLSANEIRGQASEQAVPIINKSTFGRLIVAMPPLPEQQAIAAALSDADGVVAGLERVIAKKRLIKQGAMQDLLTARRRLPGFSGEWEVKRLGELGEISGSGVDKKLREGEQPVRLLNYTDVYRETYIRGTILDHWVTAPEAKARRCSVRKGDVFFTPTSETPDDIARSAVAAEDIPNATYSYHVVRLRFKEEDCLDFWAHMFEIDSFRAQARQNADGSGTRYIVTLPKFRNMTVRIPNRKEREAIGEILRDMSIELEVLDARLAKARAVKEGMMQNLLTGRVRLV
ncbi:restriction endonuclease subunit S [Pannonibacter sp. Pt2]|uniref:Restriction endonuclease subunit S n=1 Tax=Pannonibacter anstelovis TaxID=3121537 RepID=A0ABU7ZTX5_9HYPH